MNCDFSSNNNIWASFYEFLWRPFSILLVYFYYDRLIGISRMSFLAAILNCNFRLQTSDHKFQKSPLNFFTFKYIYICLSNGIAFRVHSTHIDFLSVDLMMYHYPRHYSQGVKCIFLGEPGKWVQSFFLSVFMLYRYCSP